jgi:hypothetical protein
VSIAFNRHDHGDVMRLLELPIESVTTTLGPWLLELAGPKLAVKYWPPYGAPDTEKFAALAIAQPAVDPDAGDTPLPPRVLDAVARFAG